jgi:16S rRNA (cytidine1402-2'-O)-methyltransferase
MTTKLPQVGGDEGRGAVASAATRALEAELARPLAAGLYLVATPIGNLADVTLRALAVLARADRILCEDTRHSLKLLNHFSIRRPLEPYHDHNADEAMPKILAALGAGKRIALISDAGTPLVSDPGFKLVREAREQGILVAAIPGPSAVLAALCTAGLPTDRFTFEGFLPAKAGARRSRIEAMRLATATTVIFESPHRLKETLGELAAVLGDRNAAVARELTKLHEDVSVGRLGELATAATDEPARGEITILLGPAAETGASAADVEASLAAALKTQSLRDAVRDVAAATGLQRSRVYEIGLKLKRDGKS